MASGTVTASDTRHYVVDFQGALLRLGATRDTAIAITTSSCRASVIPVMIARVGPTALVRAVLLSSRRTRAPADPAASR